MPQRLHFRTKLLWKLKSKTYSKKKKCSLEHTQPRLWIMTLLIHNLSAHYRTPWIKNWLAKDYGVKVTGHAGRECMVQIMSKHGMSYQKCGDERCLTGSISGSTIKLLSATQSHAGGRLSLIELNAQRRREITRINSTQRRQSNCASTNKQLLTRKMPWAKPSIKSNWKSTLQSSRHSRPRTRA